MNRDSLAYRWNILLLLASSQAIAYIDDDELVDWLPLARRCADVVAFSPGVANITAFPKPEWTLAWWKPNSMGRVCVGFNTWEPVLVYGKVKGSKKHDSFLVSVVPQADTGDHPCPKPIGWAENVIERVGGDGLALRVPREQKKLGFDADIERPAAIGEARQHALQSLARAAFERLAGHITVADHTRGVGLPGQHLRRGQHAAAIKLRARAMARQTGAPDRRAGEARARIDEIVQMRERQQLALGDAMQIGELREQIAHPRAFETLAHLVVCRCHARPFTNGSRSS